MNTFQSQLKKYGSASFRELSRSMGLNKRSHIFLRQLLTGPESRTFSGQLASAGDVEINYNNVYLQSDGCCCYYGSVYDHGSIAGDDFTITLFLPFTMTLVWRMAGHVGAQTHNKWKQDGWNAFIRDNWDTIINTKMTPGSYLHQSFDATALILKDIETFFKDIVILAETVIIVLDDPNISCTLTTDNNGLFIRECTRQEQNQ